VRMQAPFILTAGFWLTMDILLWRAEFGSRDEVDSELSAAAVWEKISTVSDSLSLSVLRDGKKILRVELARNLTLVNDQLTIL
jgi:hypothetical protein